MEKFQSGLILVIWGIFKKVFVSDNLSPFVNMALYPNESIPQGLVYFLRRHLRFKYTQTSADIRMQLAGWQE